DRAGKEGRLLHLLRRRGRGDLAAGDAEMAVPAGAPDIERAGVDAGLDTSEDGLGLQRGRRRGSGKDVTAGRLHLILPGAGPGPHSAGPFVRVDALGRGHERAGRLMEARV